MMEKTLEHLAVVVLELRELAMQQSPAPSALLDRMLLCISVNVLQDQLEVLDLLAETDKLPMKLLKMNKDKLFADVVEHVESLKSNYL